MEALKIKRNWFVQFLIWAWSYDPEKLTTCKLVWGTLLLPVAPMHCKKWVFESQLVLMVEVAGFFRHWWVYSIEIPVFLVFLFAYSHTNGAARPQEEREADYQKFDKKFGPAMDWILDHTLGPIADFFFDRYCDDGPTRKLIDALLSFRKRCVPVRIID